MPEPPTSPPRPDRSWLGLVLIALGPILCCATVPLLVGAVGAAATGVIVGGVLGVVLILAGAGAAVLYLRRRRVTVAPRHMPANPEPSGRRAP